MTSNTSPSPTWLGNRLAGLRRVALGRYAGAVIGLVGACVFFSLTETGFLSWDNAKNVFAANSVVLILAVGATFVVLAGALDLSVASALTATAMVAGLVLQAHASFAVVLVVGLMFGLLLGFINGVMIAWLRIPFLVATLGTLSIYASFALIVNDGTTINVFQDQGFGPLGNLVNDNIGPLPALVVLDLVVVLIAGGVLRYTSFGRSVYAVGSNPEAARLTGIRVREVTLAVFAIGGLCAGLASLVAVGRLTAAAPTADPTLLMTTLAAVIIGGTAYTGGEGGVFGTLIGALFLGVVQNGLTLSDVPAFWQGTVSGTILIASVGIAVLREHGRLLWAARSARGPRMAKPRVPGETWDPGAVSGDEGVAARSTEEVNRSRRVQR